MKRISIALVTAVALAVAGCGGSTKAASPSSTATTTATVTQTQSATSTNTNSSTDTNGTSSTAAGGLYNDMTVLGLSVKETYNTKYRKGGAMATDVACISQSPQSAECNASYADGTSQSIAVTISADGSSWISH